MSKLQYQDDVNLLWDYYGFCAKYGDITLSHESNLWLYDIGQRLPHSSLIQYYTDYETLIMPKPPFGLKEHGARMIQSLLDFGHDAFGMVLAAHNTINCFNLKPRPITPDGLLVITRAIDEGRFEPFAPPEDMIWPAVGNL